MKRKVLRVVYVGYGPHPKNTVMGRNPDSLETLGTRGLRNS